MKKLLLILSFFVSFCASAQMEDIIASPPRPAKLVNDYTNTLTTQQKEALEAKLYRFDDSTTNQITVVIVSSTDNYSVEDAAIELGRKWGVGSKDFNNGIVLLVAKDDRKVTIQVGYGLEGAVPDVTAKSIIDNSITPNFKDGNFYRGLDQGTDDIIRATEGRYKAPANYGSKKKKDGIPKGLFVAAVLIFIILSGMFGKGGGTYVSRGGFGGWSGGSGGGWSGGGSSGGGFGGFGGGSFGGGGASGSW